MHGIQTETSAAGQRRREPRPWTRAAGGCLALVLAAGATTASADTPTEIPPSPPPLVTFTHYSVSTAATSPYDAFVDPIDDTDPHQVYVPNFGPGPHLLQLLVFLHGRGGRPQGYTEFMAFAARRGYMVIGLSYPTPGGSAPCKGELDEAGCFGAVKHEIAFGGPSAGIAGIDIASHPEESIWNRLRALLLYLRAQHRARGGLTSSRAG